MSKANYKFNSDLDNRAKSCSIQSLLIAFILILFCPMALAQPIPETCDSDYYDVLRAKSYVEGKREMEKAQRIILKPDSVLEYSCFNNENMHLGLRGGTFSEYGIQRARGNPPEFDGTPLATRIYPDNLERVLEYVVHTSLVGFLNSFSHVYAGGTFALLPNPFAGCNPMNIVWQASKCQNFDPRWWVTLEDLASRDIRQFPTPCAPSYDTDRATNINTALTAAYPAPDASGGMDRLDSLRTLMTNDSCSGTPIPTGMTAYYYDRAPQIEHVCIQPGCYYNGSDCVANN